MGNREDLLAGAKRCLYEKGYTRTTARDIAQASGVSLAAIGYHFGSKEALMNEAMFEAFDLWGEEFAKAMPQPGEGGPLERVAGILTAVSDLVKTQRPVVAASFEAALVAEHSPAVRDQLANGQQEGRRGMAAAVLGIPEDQVTEAQAGTVGSLMMALISGVLGQWLVEPAHAPSGRDIAEALRAVGDGTP